MESDYSGEILVVSNNRDLKHLESISSSVRFVLNDSAELPSCDSQIYSCMENSDSDIVILSHNDVIFPNKWFNNIVDAWNRAEINKVYQIMLPFMIHYWKARDVDEYINDMSMGYNHLVDKYSSISMYYPTYTVIPDHVLGIGLDLFNTNSIEYAPHYVSDIPNVRASARWSCVTSLRKDYYMDFVSSLDISPGNITDIAMLVKSLDDKTWSASVVSDPVIHMLSYDNTLFPSGAVYISNTYKEWFNKYHYNLQCLITIWSVLFYNLHKDEISVRLNDGKLCCVDYIFDTVKDYINNMECNSCPVNYCCYARNRKYEVT